jgi:hypothetical protein
VVNNNWEYGMYNKLSAEDLEGTSASRPIKTIDPKDIERTAEGFGVDLGFAVVVISHGVQEWNFPNQQVRRTSIAMASICEVSRDTFTPFLGPAFTSILNVVAYDGGIAIRTKVEWGSDLFVKIRAIVIF